MHTGAQTAGGMGFLQVQGSPGLPGRNNTAWSSCSKGERGGDWEVGGAEAFGSSRSGVFLADEAEQLITEGEAALLCTNSW